jgi:hypothetical protein
MKKRLFLASNIILVLALAVPFFGHADSFWGGDGFMAFCKTLRVPEKGTLESSFGAYLSVIEQREKMDLNKIVFADVKHITPLLTRAIELRWSALDFFTVSEFAAKSPCLIMLDKKSLAAINRAFDLHGLWMTSASSLSSKDDDTVMEFILLGDGRLIIGYGKEAWVRVPDYKIQARYTHYTSMSIAHRENLRALTEIKTLSSPRGDFASFQARAPVLFGFEMPIQIKSLGLSGESIVIGYRAMGGEREERRPKIPISQRCDPGCPK